MYRQSGTMMCKIFVLYYFFGVAGRMNTEFVAKNPRRGEPLRGASYWLYIPFKLRAYRRGNRENEHNTNDECNKNSRRKHAEAHKYLAYGVALALHRHA